MQRYGLVAPRLWRCYVVYVRLVSVEFARVCAFASMFSQSIVVEVKFSSIPVSTAIGHALLVAAVFT